MNITNRLLEGNNRFLAGNLTLKADNSGLEELTKNGQHPYAVIISCSDSRVIPEFIFDAGFGELFVIRVAGNILGKSELGSIEYAVHHLKSKYILVLGHTHCGAIASTLNNEHGTYCDSLLNEIKENINNITEPNEASLINAKKSADKIKSLFNKENLDVHYGLVDIESGKVTIY